MSTAVAERSLADSIIAAAGLDPDDLPATLNTEQVGRLYGASKPTVLAGAHEFERTAGAAGIPCVRISERVIRYPTAAVLAQLGLDSNATTPSTEAPGAVTDIRSNAKSESGSRHG